MVSIRRFGKSRAVQIIAAAAGLLGFAGFLDRVVTKVQSGHGLDSYTSILGYPVFPVAVVALAVVLVPAWGVTLLVLRKRGVQRESNAQGVGAHGGRRRRVR